MPPPLPEMLFEIKKDDFDATIELIEGCGIEDFWHFDLEEKIQFGIKASHAQLDEFNTARKLWRDRMENLDQNRSGQ